MDGKTLEGKSWIMSKGGQQSRRHARVKGAKEFGYLKFPPL
jgi:hypothetical protein